MGIFDDEKKKIGTHHNILSYGTTIEIYITLSSSDSQFVFIFQINDAT